MSPRRKVVLVELNEINWRLIDPLLEAGEMPELATLIADGARGEPRATEEKDDLEPWITWVSLHTGQPHEVHGIRVLEPAPGLLTHKRSWEYVADAGLSYGVFASPSSWPPRDDAAFFVPGNFSKDTRTHPAELEPIQDLNVTYSRAHNPLSGAEGAGSMVSRGLALLRLGLRPSTVLELLTQLVHERLDPRIAWRKVALQPVVNIDLFERQWRRHRPAFSTFHSNHVAHFMHRYWRAHDPSAFPDQPVSEAERAKFGGAITFGHRIADRVIGRIRRFVDDDTVIVIASSMGQKPYMDPSYRDGKPATRVRDVSRVLEWLGVANEARAVAVMAPQWNLEFDGRAACERAKAALERSWITDTEGRHLGPALHFEEHGGVVTMTPAAPTVDVEKLTAVFVRDGEEQRLPWLEVFAQLDATTKEGYHDPAGLLVMCGPGVRAGVRVDACSNLDVLPTLLAVLGLPVPDALPGRVLDEALEDHTGTAATTESVRDRSAVPL